LKVVLPSRNVRFAKQLSPLRKIKMDIEWPDDVESR
jgi:hypothetical protein